jgi:hypothetical protein
MTANPIPVKNAGVKKVPNAPGSANGFDDKSAPAAATTPKTMAMSPGTARAIMLGTVSTRLANKTRPEDKISRTGSNLCEVTEVPRSVDETAALRRCDDGRTSHMASEGSAAGRAE